MVEKLIVRRKSANTIPAILLGSPRCAKLDATHPDAVEMTSFTSSVVVSGGFHHLYDKIPLLCAWAIFWDIMPVIANANAHYDFPIRRSSFQPNGLHSIPQMQQHNLPPPNDVAQWSFLPNHFQNLYRKHTFSSSANYADAISVRRCKLCNASGFFAPLYV